MLLDGIWICTVALQLVLLFEIAQPQSIVKTLPGYDGPLPSKLETGYVGVGEKEEIQFFYYFWESEKDPRNDPLLIWFCGGPGCSTVGSLFFQIGPFEFDAEASNETFVGLRRRQYSWTQIANILTLDSPVGTGFSYSTTSEGYFSSDSKSTKHYYQFIQKWLLAHPHFSSHQILIGGDSYSGKTVPPLVYEIVKANEAGQNPKMSLQGYLIGNPSMYAHDYQNWRIPYANRMGLISDKYYKKAKKSCGGEYVNTDPNNTACTAALAKINECTKHINYMHILETTCNTSQGPQLLNYKPSYARLVDQQYSNADAGLICREDLQMLAPQWANIPAVQKALHIREGTIERWVRCNSSIDNSYKQDLENVFSYHKYLTTKPLQALVYSGDHDMVVPFLSTLEWVKRLNLTVKGDWRPWMLDAQLSGYTMKFKGTDFYLTFATVKGAGHTPQVQKPKECLEMVKRWIYYHPL